MQQADEILPNYADEILENHADEILPNCLEADQLAAETSRPVPRAVLSPRMVVALWGMRVFVVVSSAMVVYVFLTNL